MVEPVHTMIWRTPFYVDASHKLMKDTKRLLPLVPRYDVLKKVQAHSRVTKVIRPCVLPTDQLLSAPRVRPPEAKIPRSQIYPVHLST
jgi:hypothetical protein